MATPRQSVITALRACGLLVRLARSCTWQTSARKPRAIGVVGIGLVSPHIERALGLPSIKAYHRQPTFTQFRPEPGGQRPVWRPIRTAPGAAVSSRPEMWAADTI